MPQDTCRRAALIAVLLLAAPAMAWGRPVHKQALADYFGPFLKPNLNDCRTCHLAGSGMTPPKPHNPFGARLAAVGRELRKAGKGTTIADRLEVIADEDSDGDGVPNLLELLSGHQPGDPQDRPNPAEIAEARQNLARLLQARGPYPWKPFDRVVRPPVPVVHNIAWVRNPIDAFIAARHEEVGLRPRPEAPRAVLLRRVYLDLIGLSPTPDELHAFLTDPAPDAYEKVVERLLASPRYGERWGRHWMDVWRYSDWAGFGAEVRDSQPHIWHWRDWIIESLNQDKGYDRMVLEMLAADELTPEDPDALRATGYLVRNFKSLSREKWMQDTVDHTAQAFLGITLGCARCHDHMFDPILQKEYYAVRAIFEPYHVRTDRIPGQPDLARDGLPRAYDADPQALTHLFIRGDDRNPEKTPTSPGVPEVLGGRLVVEPVSLPQLAYCPDKRAFVVRETLTASATSIPAARQALQQAREKASVAVAQALVPSPLGVAIRLAAAQKSLDMLALAVLDVPVAEARHQALVLALQAEQLEDAGRKDSVGWKLAALAADQAQRRMAVLEARRSLLSARQARDTAPAKDRAVAAKKFTDAEKGLAAAKVQALQSPTTAYVHRPVKVYPRTSSGRRLAFARWLVSRDNPLTARVAMNHIWLRHFGQGIVPTVFNFGRDGRPPTHPALLDWLAAEFMERGWSMKAMHRLIVTSSTYRMASTSDPADLALDRDNQLLWRMPSRRAEAEVVRDCIFAVAGRLDLTMGGPDRDARDGLTVPRRSIYFRQAAEKQMDFLKIFDGPAVTECYQRKESIMPQQALALVNSELTLGSARALAGILSAQVGADDRAFTVAAFERVLCRRPTDQELAECLTFLAARARLPGGTGSAQRAREGLVHVLLNHNDFVTIR